MDAIDAAFFDRSRGVTLPIDHFPGLDVGFATTCGRRLVFDCDQNSQVKVHYLLRHLKPVEESRAIGDAVGLQLFLTDSQGATWATHAEISLQYIHELFEHATSCGWEPIPFVSLNEDTRTSFVDETLVSGLHFFTNDRIYREFPFYGKGYSLGYKYRSLWFDIACIDSYRAKVTEDRFSTFDVHMPNEKRLVVRARFSDDETDEEIIGLMATSVPEQYDPIPSLTFKVGENDGAGLLTLLRGNDAFLDTEHGHWERGPFVRPLVFTKMKERGTPQKTCRVV